MTVPSPYSTAPPESQAPSGAWSLPARLARTWTRNPNYRHGRWCRYRLRLERRLEQARRRVQSSGPLPAFAPAPEGWPGVGGYLPRRAWAAARQWVRMARFRAAWHRRWDAHRAAGQDGPPPLLAVLADFFQSALVRAP